MLRITAINSALVSPPPHTSLLPWNLALSKRRMRGRGARVCHKWFSKLRPSKHKCSWHTSASSPTLHNDCELCNMQLAIVHSPHPGFSPEIIIRRWVGRVGLWGLEVGWWEMGELGKGYQCLSSILQPHRASGHNGASNKDGGTDPAANCHPVKKLCARLQRETAFGTKVCYSPPCPFNPTKRIQRFQIPASPLNNSHALYIYIETNAHIPCGPQLIALRTKDYRQLIMHHTQTCGQMYI